MLGTNDACRSGTFARSAPPIDSRALEPAVQGRSRGRATQVNVTRCKLLLSVQRLSPLSSSCFTLGTSHLHILHKSTLLTTHTSPNTLSRSFLIVEFYLLLVALVRAVYLPVLSLVSLHSLLWYIACCLGHSLWLIIALYIHTSFPIHPAVHVYDRYIWSHPVKYMSIYRI